MEKADVSAINNTGETQSHEYVRKGGTSTISVDDFNTFEEMSDTNVSAKYKKGDKNENQIQNGKSNRQQEKSIEAQAKEKVIEDRKIQRELEKELGIDAKRSKAQLEEQENEDKATEAKAEDGSEDTSKVDKKSLKEEETEEDVEEVEEKPKLVPYKFKQNDEEIDLNPDALIKVKVNGNLEEVSVKDLVTEFSGKTDFKRKYSALDVERKTFQTEVRELDGRVNKLYTLAVTEKNPRLAIGYLAEMIGGDPREVWQNLKAEISKSLLQTSNLSPEQQEAIEAKEEAEYYKRKAEDSISETKKTREIEQLKSRVLSTQDKYRMSPAQFKQSYDSLVKEAVAIGYKEDDLTPEMVGEYHESLGRNNQLKEMIGTTFLSNQDKESVYSELKGVWAQNPSFSIDDIKDIAVQAFATKKKSGMAKRIENDKRKTTESTRISPDRLETWDDLNQF